MTRTETAARREAQTKSALLVMAALLALAACGQKRGGTADTAPATPGIDMIIHGGPILTMAGETPSYAEAVIIDDGRIVFVGSEAEAMAKKTAATVIKDLGGKLLLPGFIDPQSHFVDSLTMPSRVNV
jgi:adenine deaminase